MRVRAEAGVRGDGVLGWGGGRGGAVFGHPKQIRESLWVCGEVAGFRCLVLGMDLPARAGVRCRACPYPSGQAYTARSDNGSGAMRRSCSWDNRCCRTIAGVGCRLLGVSGARQCRCSARSGLRPGHAVGGALSSTCGVRGVRGLGPTTTRPEDDRYPAWASTPGRDGRHLTPRSAARGIWFVVWFCVNAIDRPARRSPSGFG